MNKKIIKAMYQNIVAKDVCRPIMNGVHFEEGRCYASDGHVLVILNEGSKALDGKTLSIIGEEIEGRYPNVDSVFPRHEDSDTEFVLDVKQLKEACAYHARKQETTDKDAVVINGVGFNICTMLRLLTTIMLAGTKEVKFTSKDKSHAVVVENGKVLRCLIMPTLFVDENVDAEAELGEPVVLSYENFINDYVFNSWKKAPAKDELAWAI